MKILLTIAALHNGNTILNMFIFISVSVSVSVSVYFHHIYHTNEQYKENIGGENQKEQSSK